MYYIETRPNLVCITSPPHRTQPHHTAHQPNLTCTQTHRHHLGMSTPTPGNILLKSGAASLRPRFRVLTLGDREFMATADRTGPPPDGQDLNVVNATFAGNRLCAIRATPSGHCIVVKALGETWFYVARQPGGPGSTLPGNPVANPRTWYTSTSNMPIEHVTGSRGHDGRRTANGHCDVGLD
jgi:hypothetical protein